jgi:hypothetical protein
MGNALNDSICISTLSLGLATAGRLFTLAKHKKIIVTEPHDHMCAEEGVQVYAKWADPWLVHALPRTPHFRLVNSGVKQAKLLKTLSADIATRGWSMDDDLHMNLEERMFGHEARRSLAFEGLRLLITRSVYLHRFHLYGGERSLVSFIEDFIFHHQ